MVQLTNELRVFIVLHYTQAQNITEVHNAAPSYDSGPSHRIRGRLN